METPGTQHVQDDHTSTLPDRQPARKRDMAPAWAVAIAGVMFGLGSLLGSTSPASQATASQVDGDVIKGAGTPVQIYQMRPPALALPEGSRALVGAADGRYYMVDCNGVAYRARFEGRSDLFWRDEVVEGTSIQIIGE